MLPELGEPRAPGAATAIDDASGEFLARYEAERGKEESVHLVVTSPPYWTLKEYAPSEAQLGSVQDFDEFLAALDQVWRECYRVLVPGGRVICVVGDVLLSRRRLISWARDRRGDDPKVGQDNVEEAITQVDPDTGMEKLSYTVPP